MTFIFEPRQLSNGTHTITEKKYVAGDKPPLLQFGVGVNVTVGMHPEKGPLVAQSSFDLEAASYEDAFNGLDEKIEAHAKEVQEEFQAEARKARLALPASETLRHMMAKKEKQNGFHPRIAGL